MPRTIYRCTRKGGPRARQCGKRVYLDGIYHEGDPKLVCPACGGKLKLDKELQQRMANERRCRCDGLWFSMKGSPHRHGSKGCIHYQGTYTEEDYQDMRDRMMKAARAGGF